MQFINVLQIPLKSVSEELVFKLEEELLNKNLGFIFDINEDNITFHKDDFLNNEKVWFSEYIEPWKFMKEFLIENKIATLENYKEYFKITKKETTPENNLDALIAEVPKDDEKLNEALAFLSKIKKD